MQYFYNRDQDFLFYTDKSFFFICFYKIKEINNKEFCLYSRIDSEKIVFSHSEEQFFYDSESDYGGVGDGFRSDFAVYYSEYWDV